MRTPTNSILTLNGGSSSIKFSFYKKEGSLQQLFDGEMENIGLDNTRISCINRVTGEKYAAGVKAIDHTAAATAIIAWLERQDGFEAVNAIGHRIVQGMEHTHPELITDGLLNALKKISAWDPEHMPRELQLIAAFRARYPTAVQIACFDTFFHAARPLVAKWVTVPRRYFCQGHSTLWIPRAFLRLSAGRTGAGFRQRDGEGKDHIGPPGQWREPCRGKGWQKHGYKYGFYPGIRFTNGNKNW